MFLLSRVIIYLLLPIRQKAIIEAVRDVGAVKAIETYGMISWTYV